MCFLITQIFCDSVATTIHNFRAVEAVGKHFQCFRNNTWVSILVSFSRGIDSRLHKFIETYNWNIFHEATNFFSYSHKYK